jgi:hypothetical protein
VDDWDFERKILNHVSSLSNWAETLVFGDHNNLNNEDVKAASNIWALYFHQGQYKDALKWGFHALKGHERCLGRIILTH